LPSSIAIRAGFTTLAVGFWAILTPGAVPHGVASPGLSGLQKPESWALAPTSVHSNMCGQATLLAQPPARDTGSAEQPIERVGSAAEQPIERVGSAAEQPIERVGSADGRSSERAGSDAGQPSERAGSADGQPTDRVGSADGQPTDRVGSADGQPTDRVGSADGQPIEQVWPSALTSGHREEPVPSFETLVESAVIGLPSFEGALTAPPAAVVAGTVRAGTANYPIVTNSQVGFFIDRFTRERREVINTWLGRSGRFISMIRDTLKKHGLPEDLAFTAMIESGFNPVATSHAGARGLWQFMAATAKRYGLRVDQWVDERLDPEKSTAAAAAYLRDLYNLFGSWFLAQAAYNAGEATVARAIRATGSSDFWALARTGFLRRETKEFVPQILAATQIGRDPDRFGFEPILPSPAPVERITVPGSTDLQWLSSSAGISVDALRSLNPVLVQGVTPPGGAFELNVPPGTRSHVLAALERPRRVTTSSSGSGVGRASSDAQAIHVVRPRDTVHSIARRYGVSVGDVLRWNDLARQDPIRPGDRLRIGHTPGGR
jgi:membrane-bound lytic murein transglycosylase D